jgi:pilus assembly protein CpaC
MKLIFLAFLLTAPLFAQETVHLKVGESISRKLPQDISLRVRGKKLIQISELATGIKITGRAPGVAELNYSGKTLRVHVAASQNLNFYEALLSLVKDLKGLAVELLGGEVIVKGSLHRLDDWLAIKELSQEHNANYVFNARLDKDIEAKALAYLKNEFLTHGASLPKIVFSPSAKIYLSGQNKKLGAQVENIARPYGLTVEYDQNQIHLEPLVRVKILVAEVTKNFSRGMGVGWPSELNVSLLPRLKTAEDLNVAIQLAESAGDAHVLASPSLIARSGGEAEFLAGGEFPIRIVSFRRAGDVVWKRHGVLLKIKPLADLSGQLKLELTTEVSMMDGEKVDDIPQLKTSRISSQFDMMNGKTIILSGLIQNSLAESQNRLPGLHKLPVIGPLFGSRNFLNNKSELIIFVTPEILNPQISEPIKLPEDLKVD